MASIKNAFLRLWPFKSDTTDSAPPQKTETRKITRALGPWEAYTVTLQSVLIWERPGNSALAVVGVNLLFWLVVWSEVRVYFVVSVVGLLVFLHQQWVHSIWPEIRVPKPDPDDSEEWTPVHPSVLSVPEISQYVEGTLRWLRDNYTWLLQLRRLQPALFSAIVTTVLSLCGVLGHMVPGAVLVYVLVMLVMTGPGFMLHLLPDSFYARINKMRAALRGDTSAMETSNVSLDSDISEFMPELQSLETQAALDVPLTSQDSPEVEEVVQVVGRGRGEGGAARTRRRSGRGGRGRASSAVSTSLTPDQSSLSFTPGQAEDFPSYDNDSVEDLDAPDIELPDLHPTRSAGHNSNNMEFVSSHFGDTSDEDDDFAEGLSFEAQEQARLEASRGRYPQPAIVPPQAPSLDPLGHMMSSMIAQNAGNIISALGQNLVTSVIGHSTAAPPSTATGYLEPSQMLPSARMTRSQDSTLQSSGELEDDFEMISDEEFQ